MKKKKGFALFVLLFMFFPFSAKGAHVIFYIGDIDAVRNAKKLPVSNGEVLQSGDVITTGQKSIINIAYNDGSTIEVMENTSIMIGSDDIKDSDNAILIFGSIKGKFTKLAKDRKVYTSTAICAIRGTEFQVSASKDGSSRIDLRSGALTVSNSYGFQDIVRGEELESETSSAPRKIEENISTQEWMQAKENELFSDPEKKADNFNAYIGGLTDSNKQKRKQLKKGLPKEPDEETNARFAKNEDEAIDNLFVSQAISLSLENLANDFEDNEDKNAYRMFKKVRKRANALRDLQRKIYNDIQKIKLEHQKAKKDILDQFNESKMKIKGGQG